MAKKDNTSVEVELWERQEGETPRAYEAFCVYRDMGPDRSLRKTVQALNKNLTTIAEWSAKYEWVKRVAAWDAENDRIARIEQLSAIKKMRKQHAELAYSMLIKAAQALKRIPADEIKASDISRMIETGSKLERISRGDVGDVIEERNGGDAVDPVQIYIPDNNRGRENDSFDDLEIKEEE